MFSNLEKEKSGIRGFTLVEQLIVLLLIVTVLGFGGVRMMAVYRHNNYDTVIKDLSVLLRFLQMKAIEDNRVYEFSLNPEKKMVVKRKVLGKDDEFELFRSSFLQGIHIGNSMTLELKRGDKLLFFPDGSTSKNQLLLAKDSGERAVLELRNRIGSVEVKRD